MCVCDSSGHCVSWEGKEQVRPGFGLVVPALQCGRGFLQEVLGGPRSGGAVEGRAKSGEKEPRRVGLLMRQDPWRALLESTARSERLGARRRAVWSEPSPRGPRAIVRNCVASVL